MTSNKQVEFHCLKSLFVANDWTGGTIRIYIYIVLFVYRQTKAKSKSYRFRRLVATYKVKYVTDDLIYTGNVVRIIHKSCRRTAEIFSRL